MIAKSSHGWALIEEERRKYGDNAVRRGITAFGPSAIEMVGTKVIGPVDGKVRKRVARHEFESQQL